LDAFLAKKLISNFVHLVPGVFLFMLLCLVLRAWWPRFSTAMLFTSVIALISLSSPPVSNRLVASLEDRYSTIPIAPDDTALILVLADGHIWAKDRSTNTVLKAIGLARITEGVRLWKTNTQAMLATSGEKFDSPVPHAEVMNDFALEQGVAAEQTVQFPETRDTEDEVRAAVDYVKNNISSSKQRLVVVSSAVHLARIELLLQKYNAVYTLAPTDFIGLGAPWHRFNGYFLENANRTLHEYVGILWLKIQRLND